MPARKRNWVFTSYYIDGEPIIFDPAKFKWISFQREICPSTGRHHWQGAFVTVSLQSLESATRLFKPEAQPPGVSLHLEVMRGTQQEAKNYTHKEDTRCPGTEPVFYGTEPPGAGARTDLVAIQQRMDAGERASDIARSDFSQWVVYNRSFEKYEQLQLPERAADGSEPPKLLVYWGPTGTGKTWHAMVHGLPEGERVQKIAYDSASGFFSAAWDGSYRVVFDEVDQDYFRRSVLLELTDRWPFRLNIKGGHSRFAPKEIAFTSNFQPDTFLQRDATPWLRRLEEQGTVTHLTAPFVPPA